MSIVKKSKVSQPDQSKEQKVDVIEFLSSVRSAIAKVLPVIVTADGMDVVKSVLVDDIVKSLKSL